MREVTEDVGGEEKSNTVYTFEKDGKVYHLKPDAGWGTNLGMFNYIPNLEKYDYNTANNTAQTLVNSKVFDKFYNRCSKIAAKIEAKAISDLTKKNKDLSIGKIQTYAVNILLNKKYSNFIKQTTFDIAVLNEEQKKLLKTNKQTLKLSAETLIKEQIKHKDLNINDFRKIQFLLQNSDVLIYENNTENLLCFKLSDKIFIIALKATKDRTKNFIKTFHTSSIKDLKKELQKTSNKIIFNKLNTEE